jgi:hypothetical protein
MDVWLAAGDGVVAQKRPLPPEKDVAALANELSGETAKRNLEGIARFHRQRGSTDVAILQFSADGRIFYGTQRSRPAWDVETAELTEFIGRISKVVALKVYWRLPIVVTHSGQ